MTKIPSKIPDTEEGIRQYLLSVMSVDPSGKTAASLVLAYIGLARKEGEIAALERTHKAINRAFDAADKMNGTQ
jgi:hypothetical protein